MDTTLKIEKQDLNASPITEEHSLFFGKVFRGMSAYQYAVESGLFSGTKEEFAEYLGNIQNVTEAAKQATNLAQLATSRAGLATQGADDAAHLATDAANSADIAAQNAQNKADLAAQEAQNAMEAGREALSIAENKGNEATTAANEAGAEAVRIATEAATNATTAANEADVATEQANNAATNANEAAQRANEEVQNLREKADTNGYYPDMTVGKAENLVGRGDVQDAVINFRPSGGVPDVGNGMNISDGAARINAIKGNSLVYNQLLLNSKFRSTSNWANYNNYTTIASDGEKLTATITSNGSIAVYQSVSKEHVVLNHTYLVIADFEASRATSWGVNMGPSVLEKINSAERKIRTLIVPVTTKTDSFAIYPILGGGEAGDYAYIYSVRLIDLTKEFCAGNEPTSYEEYLQRKPINIADEFAYNDGELLDMKVDELVSVGDNAYNPIEHKARVIGGQKYHITDGANTEDLEVTFYAFDEDENEERNIEPIIEDGKKYYIFPANGYCIVNGQVGNVCVLEHSYEKPIKPYEVDVKDLSFIKEIATKQGELLFPNGMRSADSAFDEIRYDVTKKKWVAVKRIADRVYEDEDENDTNLTTDGTTTNYALAKPIEVEIPNSENWNLDYLVWDFGTEEALVRDSTIDNLIPSAPFRAEINYGPNAVDDLRWSIKHIRALEQRVLALEQKAVQEANIEEV